MSIRVSQKKNQRGAGPPPYIYLLVEVLLFVKLFSNLNSDVNWAIGGRFKLYATNGRSSTLVSERLNITEKKIRSIIKDFGGHGTKPGLLRGGQYIYLSIFLLIFQETRQQGHNILVWNIIFEFVLNFWFDLPQN